MVDATYARALSDLVRVERGVHLGPDPKPNHHQEPWPLAMDAQGNLHVAESGAGRILALTDDF
jgi:hypothetical protein